MTRLDDARLTLIGRLRKQLRMRRYSARTEEAYVSWVRRFVRLNGMQHPDKLDARHTRQFLSHLAVTERVSASTQNQARSALLFLYRNVLNTGAPWMQDVERAKRPHRIPVVMTRDETQRVLSALSGMSLLVSTLLYGSGLRLMEALTLRVKDIDFDNATITVHDGKGAKDRLTILPVVVVNELRKHLVRVERLWRIDLRNADFSIELPNAFAKKSPASARDLRWYWLFPARRTYVVRDAGRISRSHLHATAVQRAVSAAVREVGLTKRVSCHTFRHSFATHLLDSHYDIRTIQELLGHSDVSTTMIYTHVLNKGGRGVRSPADERV